MESEQAATYRQGCGADQGVSGRKSDFAPGQSFSYLFPLSLSPNPLLRTLTKENDKEKRERTGATRSKPDLRPACLHTTIYSMRSAWGSPAGLHRYSLISCIWCVSWLALIELFRLRMRLTMDNGAAGGHALPFATPSGRPTSQSHGSFSFSRSQDRTTARHHRAFRLTQSCRSGPSRLLPGAMAFTTCSSSKTFLTSASTV